MTETFPPSTRGCYSGRVSLHVLWLCTSACPKCLCIPRHLTDFSGGPPGHLFWYFHLAEKTECFPAGRVVCFMFQAQSSPSRAKGDDSTDKGACLQTRRLEFNPQNPQGGRREPPLLSFPNGVMLAFVESGVRSISNCLLLTEAWCFKSGLTGCLIDLGARGPM